MIHQLVYKEIFYIDNSSNRKGKYLVNNIVLITFGVKGIYIFVQEYSSMFSERYKHRMFTDNSMHKEQIKKNIVNRRWVVDGYEGLQGPQNA